MKKLNSILIVTLILAITMLFTVSAYGGSSSQSKKVSITKSKAKTIKLVDYKCKNFSMKIPKGWVVKTGGTDMFYAIRVYNPKDGRYQIFSILKASPFLKSDQAKNWYTNYYNSFGGEGNRLLAEATVLYEPTVENFYCNFNDYAKFCKSVEPGYGKFKFPDLKNFAAVEAFESNTALKNISCDDKTLRGTFQTSKGKNGEGLFMASIIDNGSYFAMGFDAYFYSAYNVMGITTAENELVNYRKILTKSLSSLKYTKSFTNTTIKNGQEQTQNALSINSSVQEGYDSYNAAWESRQKTYDIISQKQSDATLGYERVYDTETKEIYKAYNGFTDDYSGKRYKPVTDSMYTKAIAGYIKKK